MINIKNRRGFTLVEMMVVISLMAVLLVMMVSNAQKQKLKARDNIRVAAIQVIRLAVEDYKLACGEYPSHIKPDVHNGHCPEDVTFKDFLAHIPVAPNHENSQLTGSGGAYQTSEISGSNGYLYAGLSTTGTGRCYDYHIGVELEAAVNYDEKKSHFLDEDHDFKKNTNPFRSRCPSSNPDFSSNPNKDDDYGLYDFRSNSL